MDWRYAFEAYTNTLLMADRRDEAEAVLKDGLARLEEARGPGHERTVAAREKLADAYAEWGRADEAAALRLTPGVNGD